jgi:hypothetical protein
MLFLGVLGLYLGRLCEQSRGRPLFVIESIVRGPGAGGTDERREATGSRREPALGPPVPAAS